jgi:hypothetical protein
MSKFKKGLAVDRDVGDPMRRPRPVSQEGYYYPEEHVNDRHFLHPNSRRQPIRQYGSSASLEVRHEQNRRQREQDFFSSPSATPNPASFENSRNTPVMQSEFRNADSSVYYQQPAKQTSDYQSRRTPNSREVPRSIPNSNSHAINTSNTHLGSNQNSYHSNSPDFSAPQSHSLYNSRVPSPRHQIPPSNYYLNSTSQESIQNNPPGNSMNLQRPNVRDTQYQNLHIPPGHRNHSQHYSSRNPNKTREVPIVDNNPQNKTREAPIVDNNSQNKTREAPIVDSSHTQIKTREVPILDNNHTRNKTREAPIVDNNNNNNNAQRLNLPDPVSIEDYISQAIKYHEDDQLVRSTEYLRIAADKGSAVGKVLYGIALRHGWVIITNNLLIMGRFLNPTN